MFYLIQFSKSYPDNTSENVSLRSLAPKFLRSEAPQTYVFGGTLGENPAKRPPEAVFFCFLPNFGRKRQNKFTAF
ncbi:MAG: hypothetical protein A2646_00465 [Candidatus Portnoybacteria bacterium RIFCSPHIGHO2_02_FULL_39_12]|uniref:Uncharacterized protein n=1 Tax=Candidatus Portnoybacteria bacterium RIFCSPHIGHO2_12_FULL_38_9 TaxID=1801997 RepID=A0A1G2FJB3_9BACT|nr:MAG: hypothetical protein A3H00_02405 [Candidatus Portnoybacteria bacterium RBG_13_40_8]OGZ36866.1 MAG: hypothetical protein A2646_00465 [Candidatus Portnoybacteria bacterium RIFCSPHIGHO2_02_FULL_39_12]OGZ37621.1 MAG: hypothetical protein A3J64_02900 [Candidatus Portnoybacteria bacterium RIFCSPHIGHO2_12_FULL_38_9]OGZ39536.1 MAG: hypothetical protein A3F21_03710 [Candidatus Portnoybacteria bacterium RIFCSPLOWO2_01_FULL_38_39]